MTSMDISDLVLAKTLQLQQDASAKTGTVSVINLLETSKLDPQVAEVYQRVGEALNRYKSGKLPKALKVIPTLKNWEEILECTNYEQWTHNATLQATRIFVSNLDPERSTVFLQRVLLPKIRQDIHQNKKLNVHLFQALKKSLYKPAAFYKGIVLPICEDEGTTLKEASIISGIISASSIPVLFSAAALLNILNQPYSGARSIVIKTLLSKRYALPERVIDALVQYFLRTAEEARSECPDAPAMPVLWHQCLLQFAQRYKSVITADQRSIIESINRLLAHSDIAPEVQRELDAAMQS